MGPLQLLGRDEQRVKEVVGKISRDIRVGDSAADIEIAKALAITDSEEDNGQDTSTATGTRSSWYEGWFNLGNVREYLEGVNDKLEGYMVNWISPDRYKSMEALASKYGVEVDIGDEKSLEKAYKKVSLKTHPDKTIRLEEEVRIEAEADFKKATEIKEGTEGNFNIAEKVYGPVMNVVQKANLGIKGKDVTIETVRAISDPSVGNIVKATTGGITAASLFMGKTGVMKYTLPIEMGYKVYEGDYTGAVQSGISGVATTLAYSALCARQVLCVPVTVGMTAYGGWNVLKNGYNLYNELFTEQKEGSQLIIQNGWLIVDSGTQSVLVEEYGYWSELQKNKAVGKKPAIRNIKHRYGITGDSENIFRREKKQ